MEFFRLFLEVGSDWPAGTLAVVVIAFCSLLLVVLIVWGCFVALDTFFVPLESANGVVVRKKFTKAHTELIATYNVALKMPMVDSVHHPDDWLLEVRVGQESGVISVSKAFFYETKVDALVPVKYVIGRLSGQFYLKEVG